MFKLFSIRSPKGFTLIEAMIVMSIGVLGAVSGFVVLAGARGTLAGTVKSVTAQQEARNVVERIAREIRESAPDTIMISSGDGEGYHYISFQTPRDSDRRFVVDQYGQPVWQRSIGYIKFDGSNNLYRYQQFGSSDAVEEMVSKNVERIHFSKISAEEAPFNRPQDLVGISIRTFAEHDSIGDVADSYADFHTTVKMRN